MSLPEGWEAIPTKDRQLLEMYAARYNWLRTAGAWESEIGLDILSEDPAKFDAAVDERMSYESVRMRPD